MRVLTDLDLLGLLSPAALVAVLESAVRAHDAGRAVTPARTQLAWEDGTLLSMISRLEDAIRSSKQLVADASHELRTPLTVIRGELEGLAQDGALRGETREALGSVLEEVDRLSKLVEGLLALSRLDAGEAPAEWVRFDLAQLAADTAEQMGLLAEDKRVSLRARCAGAVMRLRVGADTHHRRPSILGSVRVGSQLGRGNGAVRNRGCAAAR